MIPPWVAKFFEKAKADALTGSLTVVFRSGEAKHVKREEVVHAPEEPVQGRTLTPACPKGCGPMGVHDYGNLYICAICQTKRTRAQIQGRSG